uniref:Chloroplast unusual positioning 1A n=1 Tax=Adiantum capillus-veneris TaxID=13818 RepID=B3IYT7_ADICA|nr:chloroplast unusual positioning 1A [Adiantum capillus-veneris]
MIVRVVFAVTSALVAVTISQLKGKRSAPLKQLEPPPEEEIFDEDGKEIYTYADAADASKGEEEEVKRISISVCASPALSTKSFQDNDQLLLPEIDDLFQGGTVVEFPSDSERSVRFRDDKSKLKYDSDDSFDSRRYDSNSEDDEALDLFESLTIAHNKGPKLDDVPADKADMTIVVTDSVELTKLKALVAELQQKEVKLETELLEYYGLKEQERDHHLELERQLRRKSTEIEKLNGKIKALEEQKKSLSEELIGKDNLKKELEAARAKIKDLQKTIQSDAGQTKAQLLILKQQVATLQAREQEASKRDFDMEKKMQTLKELEVEVVELRRTSKELQHQKRELTVQLAAAEAKIAELLNMTESDVVARVQSEASALKQANDDLSKQVEGLQMNRFSEVEELVYLRWVNACLRYELRNYQAPPGKFTALDLGKNLSPRSQEKAKQLMMEYAGPDLLAAKLKEQGERDFDTVSSVPSTPSEYDFDEAAFESQSGRHSTSKKSGLMKKLKKWGRSKDESQLSPASSSLDLRGSPLHRHSGARGPLESIMIRNNSDSVAITTYGTNEIEGGRLSNAESGAFEESLGKLAPIRTRQSVDAGDSAGDVAASFQLMAKSVAGVLEDKYPAFKDRHKLALAREKAINEKAEQARTEKFKAEPYVPSKLENKFTPGKLSEKLKLPQRGADIVTSYEQNVDRPEVQKMKFSEIEKRAPRVAKPPPKASSKEHTPGNMLPKAPAGGIPGAPPPPPPPPRAPGAPPPPPPPPGSLKSQGASGDKVQRAPEVVEFYQSLMRREAKNNTSVGATDVNVSDARNNLIGEIENRSAFLLAVKADVETQGEFVQSLAAEVRDAAYTDIEDVVAFVSWLDEELSFLVDERAVLKHFDWPENKADALREAAFEYQDLKKLEVEATSFQDDSRLPCELSLKKMLSLLEKVESSVYALLRTRDMAIARYKEFGIPTQWMQDSGLVGKIKLATVQLARKYMKRVAAELDASTASTSQDPQREFLLLQGVRFAFRVHQFAGGFDAESMRTFEELRDRIRASTEQAPSESNEA